MSKSHVLFSLALGGLALVGCKEEPAAQPVAPTTAPTTIPTTSDVKAAADNAQNAVDKAKTDAANAGQKLNQAVGDLNKAASATTAPSSPDSGNK